jgi:hypothetical protein
MFMVCFTSTNRKETRRGKVCSIGVYRAVFDPGSPDFETKPDGGGVIFTGCVGRGGAVAIPASIDGKPVTGIGAKAFFDCFSLTSVTLPESVITIGGRAFAGCESLKPEARTDIERLFGRKMFE